MLIQCWKNAYGDVSSGSSHTRAPVVLPIFEPSSAVSSGQHRACTAMPRLAADEVDAREDVAPLVRAADLQLAALVLVQVGVVVGLEEHVAELRVGDAVLAGHAGLHALPGHHLVHGDVLADVAEEVEQPDVGGPREVVDERPAPLGAEDPADLLLDGGDVGRQRLDVEEVALLGAAPGSPTIPVAPPASAMGRWPASWNRRSMIRPIRLPWCRLGAVGSQP